MLTPCIEFQGYLDKNGYGQVTRNMKRYYVHRLSYCEYNGVTHDSILGIVIRHKCDNPACINGEHLEPGTQAQNMDDMRKRGRQSRGASRPMAKLTEDVVREIRRRWVPRCKTNGIRPLAREYGISESVLHGVVQGKTWKHILT
jgi:hypothetical protein